MAKSLSEVRRRIDALDARMVRLLSARAKLAQQAWKAKGGTAAYKPEREAQVLRRVRELNRGPLSGAALARLFTEIMSACRALEDQMAVAYLGPAGTFSQEAVVKHFGSATGAQAHATIDEVFRAVETGARQDGYYEIVKGLAPGDRVAVDGAGFLTDNAVVALPKPRPDGTKGGKKGEGKKA